MKKTKFYFSKKLFFTCLFIFSLISINAQTKELNKEDAIVIKAIYDESLTSRDTYKLLDHLCNNIGHRLSGSAGASKAVEWTEMIMNSYGFDKTYKQDLFVPNWKRGDKEEARIIGQNDELRILALGMSVSTPKKGISAKVIEVKGVEDLEILGKDKIKGKIVFFNRPTDQRLISTGSAYGGAVDQRTAGPAEAAKYGAVAVVIRSIGTAFDDVPHTGVTRYVEGTKKIPAAALGVISADLLTQALKTIQMLSYLLK